MTPTDAERARELWSKRWFRPWDDDISEEGCIEVIAAEFAAVRAEALREAFERTREACVALLNRKPRRIPDDDGSDIKAMRRLTEALTFEQVMGEPS